MYFWGKQMGCKLRLSQIDETAQNRHCRFRWIQCQLDFIASCRTPKGIKAALNDLPAGLYETYARILKAIDAEGIEVSKIARKTLTWLVGSVRPTTLREVVEAIMIEPGERSLDGDLRVFEDSEILTICKSLVDYNRHDGIISLSHFTVKVTSSLQSSRSLSECAFSFIGISSERALRKGKPTYSIRA
jgi:hypothetical protein